MIADWFLARSDAQHKLMIVAVIMLLTAVVHLMPGDLP